MIDKVAKTTPEATDLTTFDALSAINMVMTGG